MSPDEFERLEHILNSLEPETKRMNDNARRFVQDQLERVERYGINVRMSPKQMDWLESLHTKLVGPLETAADSRKAARRDTLGDDDDEVPF